jgi:hypothetical protein
MKELADRKQSNVKQVPAYNLLFNSLQNQNLQKYCYSNNKHLFKQGFNGNLSNRIELLIQVNLYNTIFQPKSRIRNKK